MSMAMEIIDYQAVISDLESKRTAMNARFDTLTKALRRNSLKRKYLLTQLVSVGYAYWQQQTALPLSMGFRILDLG